MFIFAYLSFKIHNMLNVILIVLLLSLNQSFILFIYYLFFHYYLLIRGVFKIKGMKQKGNISTTVIILTRMINFNILLEKT